MAVNPLRMVVVGVGRIGIFHARHIQELATEQQKCVLVAVVDRLAGAAERVARSLQPAQANPISAFTDVSGLIAAGIADAAVIASRTEDHVRDARPLVDAGYRVLLEKPIAHSAEAAAGFVAHLRAEPVRNRSLMLAFMRRFDGPLLHAKRLLDSGAIGKPFKITSILEDNHPPPGGYRSPGLLPDMSVHNIDEIVWLLGRLPRAVFATGANLHNYKVTTVEEDLDDAFLQLWFEDAIGQVHVSRNHVAGYRNETRISGDRGAIHVGHFQEDPMRVVVEAYDAAGVIEKEVHRLRYYGQGVPVFITRFGEAYKQEVCRFVSCCVNGEPFPVTQDDGFNALLIAEAGHGACLTAEQAAAVPYRPHEPRK